MHLYRNQNNFKNGYFKLIDSVLENKQAVTEILKTSLTALENTISLSKRYDVFKARLRDSLRLLCIKEKRKKVITEDNLVREIEKLESDMKNTNDSHKKSELLEILDSKTSALSEIKMSEAKLEMKKIKNLFMEANEGDPKFAKQLATTLRPEFKIQEFEASNGSIINDKSKIFDELVSFYAKQFEARPKNQETDEQQNKFLEMFFKEKREKLCQFHETNDLEHEEITEFEVERAINKLNKDSAPGPDGLTSNLYKKYSDLFVPLLTDVFNDIIKTGVAPPSFNMAIIKLIPKKSLMVKKVSDLRPLSLINSDQKILSHILAFRIKPICNAIIENHQYAHFPKRDIHSALTKIRQYSIELKKDDLLCALDFSKAFDCVDRDFMLKMLEYLAIDNSTMSLIKTLYADTKSIIDFNSEFSEILEITRGVRQGCPLSALLFNLVMEPLLERIQNSKKILSSQKQKVIAYADDITVAMKATSINRLLKILEKFQALTGLAINYDKSEILAKTRTIPNTDENKQIKVVDCVKILGVKTTTKGTMDPETRNEIWKTINQIPKFINKNTSFRARAINIETFVLSKIIYKLRHFTQLKTFLKKLKSKMVDNFWLQKKHNVSQDVIHTERRDGGIGLKNLNKAVSVAKIMNVKVSLANEPEKNFQKSKWFKMITSDLKKDKIEMTINTDNTIILHYFFQNLTINVDTKSKEVYDFLNSSLINISCLPRIAKTAFSQNIDTNILDLFVKKLWNNTQLQSFDKNYIYLFIMNAYPDKQEKWLQNLVPHPLCFACETEFESWQHLFFDCEKIQNIKTFLNLRNWQDIWLNENPLAQKLVVALLLSSWSEYEGKYLKYIKARCQV